MENAYCHILLKLRIMEVCVAVHNFLYTDRWTDESRHGKANMGIFKSCHCNAPPILWCLHFFNLTAIYQYMLLKVEVEYYVFQQFFDIMSICYNELFFMTFINPSVYRIYTDIYLGNFHSCRSVSISGRRESHICLVKEDFNIQN
jgi:hypothetical protein